MTASEKRIVLQGRDIGKAFPGLQALNRVNCDIYYGQVNAIVGENGAGKSTLMNIFCGIYQDYEGEIYLDDAPVSFKNAKDAENSGIAIIHQELNLVSQLSVAENVFLGREFVNALGFIDKKRMNKETERLLAKLKLDIRPDTPVSGLRVGQQQIVEIAKALSLNARILIMDEPTSAISENEVQVLFDLILTLKEEGVTIIYITHKLDELFEIGDRVMVLRDGQLVYTGGIGETTQDEIIRKMVGRDIDEFFVKEDSKFGDMAIRLDSVSLRHSTRAGEYSIRDLSFELKKGEVLGIFGLMGSGRTELLETIFGIHSRNTFGSIYIEEIKIELDSPGDAVQAGIALVPEDRNLEGLILGMSVSNNISMANIEAIERNGFLNSKLENSLASRFISQLGIRTTSSRQIVEYLSGGNQQKVVIAKWLATNPKVLLLDEPTRGIDVNAKNEIYRLISDLAAAGLGIIVVSSELPEIMAIADRIIVLSEGRKTGEFLRSDANEENLMQAAIPRSMVSTDE